MANNFFMNKVLDIQSKRLEELKEECVRTFGDNSLRDDLSLYNESTGYICPSFWDGILCWGNTLPNTTVSLPCPSHITGFVTGGNATRLCTGEGHWFAKENHSWTNYIECMPPEKEPTIIIPLAHMNISAVLEQNIELVKTISRTGYIVSFVTLVIAFAIMLFIRKLHCARNILHMHLFASFILRALIFIIKDVAFIEGVGLLDDFSVKNESLYFYIDRNTNNWLCKSVASLWQYFLTANYSWILMEGLYLYNLIFRALFADSCNSVKWYIIMGWGLPLVITALWVVAKVIFEDTLCWTLQDNYKVKVIIAVPILISVLLNFVIFLRISLVLYNKLRSPVNEDSQTYKKWMKSTLVLVPLFGVHYALWFCFFYPMKTNKTVELIWLILDRLFGSFQGFFVAILYCFLNGEVKAEILPHVSYLLRFLAMNKYTRNVFPFRKKFLRSVVGRSSICTTMSCSSLYTNGILHRNSKCRLDSIPRLKQQQSEKPISGHVCHNNIAKSLHDMSKSNSKPLHRHSSQQFNVAETTLSALEFGGDQKCQSEEEIRMVASKDF